MKRLLRRYARRARRSWRRLNGNEPRVGPLKKLRSQYVGSDYGGWAVLPHLLSHDSIVYSFGIGEDISFDLQLIESFGLTVHGFDPTPKSIDWIRRQPLNPRFRMHEYGLAKVSGTLVFRLPTNPLHVSCSAVDSVHDFSTTIALPVQNLNEITETLGHHHLDIVKMDIEGSEYDVLSNIESWRPTCTQLLVEFHHRFTSIGVEATKSALTLIEQNGFAPFWVSDSGEEFGFVNSRFLD